MTEQVKILQKEVEILIRKNETLKDEILLLQHQVERLMPFGCQVEVSKKIEKEIKSEARKEFAEILKHKIFAKDYLSCEPCDMADIIDNILKEMEGE